MAKAKKDKVIPASEPTPEQKVKLLNKELVDMAKDLEKTTKFLASQKMILPELKKGLKEAKKLEALKEEAFGKAESEMCAAQDEVELVEREIDDALNSIINGKGDVEYLKGRIAGIKNELKALGQRKKK